MTLQKAAELTFRIMGLKENESLLIVTDINKKDIAEEFLKVAKTITDKTKIIETIVGEVHGEDPPEDILKEMQNYDVEVLITTTSLTHTKAARDAAVRGARVASLPGILKETLERFAETDIELLDRLGKKLQELIKKTKNVRITTDKGTDLSFSVTKDPYFHDYSGGLQEKGASGNIPLGEVCCRIPDENANGKFVIDLSVLDELVDEPIEVIVKDNYAVSIKGGEMASKLKEELDKFGKKAYFIAEFGLGTNNSAKAIGNVLEDEKVLGTCHIAFGNNIAFRGGKNDVPIHIDCIINKPTIYFDDKKIMDKGKFLI